MDPFNNNLRNYNVGNITDRPEEKVSSDASESPQINDNTRMTAQYLLQQQMIQQMQDEASRQQQIAQLVRRQQQERQVQNFPERIPEDIRRLLMSGQYNTMPSTALLQLQLQTQLELQQQQQLQQHQRELGHIENQLLIQQQMRRDQQLHLQQQQIDPSTILPRQSVLRQLASLNPNDYADLISSYSTQICF